jgi:hypothetical protein
MFDNGITRYGSAQGSGGGVNSDTQTGFFSDMGIPNPWAYHIYQNDFDTYATGDFTVTTVTSGSPTQALSAAQGGVLLLTNTTGTSDSTSMQLKAASFQLVGSSSTVGGLRNWGKMIAKVSSTAPNLFLGLVNTTTTPIAGVTDGIYLTNSGTALTFSIVANSGTAQTLTTGMPTLVAGSYFTFTWYYDGGVYSAGGQTGPQYGRVVVELKGAGVSANFRGEIACGSTFPYTTLLNPTWELQNTTGIASTLAMDFVGVIQDRSTILATAAY